MQIILSKDECITLHDALLDKKTGIEADMKGRGQTMKAMHMKLDVDELDKLIKRFEPYTRN